MSLQSMYFFMYHYQSAVVILFLNSVLSFPAASFIDDCLSANQLYAIYIFFFPHTVATLYHHSHAKQAVKLIIIIIIIVWNVHDQVYIFILVILMHSALCIYFILLNWCHDTASACLYSNYNIRSNIECNG